MSLLASVTLYLGHGQALDADAGERFAHFIQLERLDNGHHNFHLVSHPLFVLGTEPTLLALADQ